MQQTSAALRSIIFPPRRDVRSAGSHELELNKVLKPTTFLHFQYGILKLVTFRWNNNIALLISKYFPPPPPPPAYFNFGVTLYTGKFIISDILSCVNEGYH